MLEKGNPLAEYNSAGNFYDYTINHKCSTAGKLLEKNYICNKKKKKFHQKVLILPTITINNIIFWRTILNRKVVNNINLSRLYSILRNPQKKKAKKRITMAVYERQCYHSNFFFHEKILFYFFCIFQSFHQNTSTTNMESLKRVGREWELEFRGK